MAVAIIYSCIAFSIVFIVLGGLTVVIYAMRIATGAAGAEKPDEPSPVVDAAQSVQSLQPANVKSQHVAAITAAILAATQGRGKIVNIAPVPQNSLQTSQPQQRMFSSETTQIWRTVAIVENSSRRLAPAWKQRTI
ncbi:MAG: OadG family protein [Synergistaceae bacterium]|nr:OadG family protein [Synergistaceae bacterium]